MSQKKFWSDKIELLGEKKQMLQILLMSVLDLALFILK